MAFYRKHVSLCIEMRLFPDKSKFRICFCRRFHAEL